jgi:hypothetical protein
MKKKYQARVKARPEGQTSIVGHYAYLKYMLALPKRVDRVGRDLRVLNSTFAALFSDENFVTLLRAESMAVPTYLKPLVEEETKRAHEII